MTLASWLSETKTSKAALGRRVGVSGEHIARIAKGEPSVSLALALAIHRETGVKVGHLADASDRDIKAVARVLGERAA
jgi:transcriptional regulator with XRE-family HTH domain